MTEHLTVDGGTIAYEVTGASGPLVVVAHGMGDSREAYRVLTPALVEAGHLVALVEHLGGPAALIGHSFAGGGVTIAAATAREPVTAVVELGPFTRKQQIRLGDLRSARFRRA